MSEEQDIDTFHQFIQGAGAFKIENDGGMRQEIGGRQACLRTCLAETSMDLPLHVVHDPPLKGAKIVNRLYRL